MINLLVTIGLAVIGLGALLGIIGWGLVGVLWVVVQFCRLALGVYEALVKPLGVALLGAFHRWEARQ